MNRNKKPSMNKVKIGGIVYEIEKITDLQGKQGEWGHIEYKTCRIVLDDSAGKILYQVLVDNDFSWLKNRK